MRYALRCRQLPEPNLMQDLARLFVAEIVDLAALVRRQEAQRALGNLGTQRQRLHRRDQRIAPERHGEPGDPGGRYESAVHVVDQQPQVLERAAQELIEELVIGLDRRRG